jgi:hypothetical protein
VRPLASCLPLCSRNLSGDVSRADESHAENAMGRERVIHLAKETTDAERERNPVISLNQGQVDPLLAGGPNLNPVLPSWNLPFRLPPSEW